MLCDPRKRWSSQILVILQRSVHFYRGNICLYGDSSLVVIRANLLYLPNTLERGVCSIILRRFFSFNDVINASLQIFKTIFFSSTCKALFLRLPPSDDRVFFWNDSYCNNILR